MVQTGVPAGYRPELWALVTPLRDAMSARRLAQKQLARVAGVDRSTVSRWLSGRTLPPLESLLLMAAHLDVDAVTLRSRWDLAAEVMRDPHVRRDAYLAGALPRLAWSATRTLCGRCVICCAPRAYPSESWSAGIVSCAARRSGLCCAATAVRAWRW